MEHSPVLAFWKDQEWREGHVRCVSSIGHSHMLTGSSIVRMAAGGVAVFSPVALTPDVKKTVSSLGELKYITAPDFEVTPKGALLSPN